jgi:hypothetical protein
MIDENTSAANVQSVIVYVCLLLDDYVRTYFFLLIPLSGATTSAIFDILMCFMTDFLAEQLVGFCRDGASCVIGQFGGVATLLKTKCPLMKTFHCMAHGPELAVKYAVDTINAISHFRYFTDELYKVCSMSQKNQVELQAIADALSTELMKVHKVFDVRWVFSAFVAMPAVLRNLPVLCKHLEVVSAVRYQEVEGKD